MTDITVSLLPFIHETITLLKTYFIRPLIVRIFFFCYYYSDGFEGPVEVEYIYSGSVVTGIRYIIVSTTEHDAGRYSCTVTNKFGSHTKDLNLYVHWYFGGGESGSGENQNEQFQKIKAAHSKQRRGIAIGTVFFFFFFFFFVRRRITRSPISNRAKFLLYPPLVDMSISST